MRIIFFTIFIVAIGFIAQAQTIQRVACSGNLVVLDSLLKTTDINIKTENESNLLHFATYCRQEKVFEYLIKKGIKTDEKNKLGDNPLFYAVQSRNIKMAKTLLEKGADVNNINTDGLTSIFNAVQSNNMELLKLLLQANADVNLGTSALHSAVLNNNLEIVKKLITKETNIDVLNEYGNTPLSIAMREGSSEIAEFLITKGADRKKVPTYKLKGDYLGQTKPDTIPVMFAKNIVSNEIMVHSPTFSSDGNEVYYTVESRKYHGGTIFVSKQVNGAWTTPKPENIDGNYREIDPFISPDNKTMFYCSNRPLVEGDSATTNSDMWMVKRNNDKWSKPIHLGDAINNSENDDWFPTVSNNGTLFYSTGPNRTSNIVYSKFKNGTYQKPTDLGSMVNSENRDYDPMIAPDESFVIFSSNRPGGFGSVDLYISFKNAKGNWTKAKNMGNLINTESVEFAPRLSNDGKYLFFNRGGDIYWVSSDIYKK